MSPEDFVTMFSKQIQQGNHILDLGAGERDYSRMFANRGAIVTAVDSNSISKSEDSITRKRLKVEDFVPRDSSDYDHVFMRNILQFFDKQWVFDVLFPWIEDHLNANGIIGIETFYQDPIPSFDHPMRSLYTLPELASHFLTWHELYSGQYDHRGPDMQGRQRRFFDLVVKRLHSA